MLLLYAHKIEYDSVFYVLAPKETKLLDRLSTQDISVILRE